GQGPSIAPTRLWSSHGRPPVRAREIFGTHHALVHTPSTPTAFAGLIAAFLPGLVGQITGIAPSSQKYSKSPRGEIRRGLFHWYFPIGRRPHVTTPHPPHAPCWAS